MKTEEDEAFDDLAKKQGSWGGGFKAKRAMAADKVQEPWNEDEWRRNNWRCGHGWLRGEQCEICNAAKEPPSEWAVIKAILDEYGLQAIDFVADFKAALAQPLQEPVTSAWSWREVYFDEDGIPLMHRSPPERGWVGLTLDEIEELFQSAAGADEETDIRFARLIEAKLKEKNT